MPSPVPAPGTGPYIVQDILAQSRTISANTTYSVNNPGFHTGLVAYLNISALPATSASFNIAIFAVDFVTSAIYAINTPGVARTTSGLTRYEMGPALTAAGNSAIACYAPSRVFINLSLSSGAGGTDFVFSLGLEWKP